MELLLNQPLQKSRALGFVNLIVQVGKAMLLWVTQS